MQRTSPKSSFRCVAHGEHVLTGARTGNWRACTCSPLNASQRSTRCSTAPAACPAAPPASTTRCSLRLPACPALFSTIWWSLDAAGASVPDTARWHRASNRRARWLRQRCSKAVIFRRLGRPARAPPAAEASLCRSLAVCLWLLSHVAAARKKCAHGSVVFVHSCVPDRVQACLLNARSAGYM